MAQFDVVMPKMGESIEEATITKWFVKEGDTVEEDDVLLEIATDKVDSEIPSPVEGVIQKILFSQDEVVAVGTVIAVINMDGDESGSNSDSENEVQIESGQTQESKMAEMPAPEKPSKDAEKPSETRKSDDGRFYSPLVRKIAEEENISSEELSSIRGSGLNGRVQKKDILAFLESRDSVPEDQKTSAPEKQEEVREDDAKKTSIQKVESPKVKPSGADDVIEMSRMRKLIASHMIHSKQTSAHVTNMLEIDVTDVVEWRNRVKEEFMQKTGQKLTYLPVFLEATVRSLRAFPMINSSVDGDKIIIRKNINLGIAVSLEDNNLIVPNIKDADQLNLTGLTTRLNELAKAARSNQLNPDDITGGSFTVTNFGTFRNDIGTPIINQPEVAILAIGAIKKKPAVLETEHGDVIAIRHKMWLSLTYDHRIIDGALGGAFLRTLGDYIESFDARTTF